MRFTIVTLIVLLCLALAVGPASAATVKLTFTIEVHENDDHLKVNGTEILVGDLLYYTVEVNTSAVGSGPVPVGSVDYKNDSIQAGGSLLFGGVNMVTNNSTATVSAINFEVKNSNAGSEDKWKTEVAFTDVATMTFDGAGNTSAYAPKKIKIEIKSSDDNFLSTSALPQASVDFVANMTDSLLASLTDDNKKKFELEWDHGPKIKGRVTSVVPEPGTMALAAFGGLAVLLRRRRARPRLL